MQGWGWKPPFPAWHRPAAGWERRAGGEGVSPAESLSEPTWEGGSSSPCTPRPPPHPHVISDLRATTRPQYGPHGLVGQARPGTPRIRRRAQQGGPESRALCPFFPDLNRGSSGAPKGTASTRQASGAPLLGPLCPPPRAAPPAQANLRLDSQRH